MLAGVRKGIRQGVISNRTFDCSEQKHRQIFFLCRHHGFLIGHCSRPVHELSQSIKLCCCQHWPKDTNSGRTMSERCSRLKLLLVILLACLTLRISSQATAAQEQKKKKGIPQWMKKIFPQEEEKEEGKTEQAAESEKQNDTFSAWVDEVGGKTSLFLKNKVFGQTQSNETDKPPPQQGFLTLFAGGSKEATEESPGEGIAPNFRALFDRLWQAKDDGGDTDGTNKENSEKKGKQEFLVEEFLQRTTLFEQSTSFSAGNINEILKALKEATSVAIDQMSQTFGGVMDKVGPSTTLALIYYLADQESKHTPSWKRRQHRFYNKVTPPLVVELHDALFLSQLTYVSSVDEFRSRLREFQSGAWELAYGTTDSLPQKPAHFLLIHKNPKPMHESYIESLLPWDGPKEYELEVILAIRGTKDLADIIADATLEVTDYRDGKAHGGIVASGKTLVDFYTPKLKELLEHSERHKIKLFIVGHSLGAGAGAIAAMEFNDMDFINVEAMGFGCPSLLSRELSESTKDYVTTVVADADAVPRMSGASVMNALLDLIDFNWTEAARDDLNFTVGRAQEVTPVARLRDMLPPKETVLKWSEDFFNYTRPKTRERVPVVLMPPGNCIHFFRDGVSYSGTFTPCEFFTMGVELSRTLVEDHLVVPGYHRVLVSMMRDWKQDLNVSIRY
eukprot:scaffold23539_cov137-Cylindrotheca_fusiformis.AAC.4